MVLLTVTVSEISSFVLFDNHIIYLSYWYPVSYREEPYLHFDKSHICISKRALFAYRKEPYLHIEKSPICIGQGHFSAGVFLSFFLSWVANPQLNHWT